MEEMAVPGDGSPEEGFPAGCGVTALAASVVGACWSAGSIKRAADADNASADAKAKAQPTAINANRFFLLLSFVFLINPHMACGITGCWMIEY